MAHEEHGMTDFTVMGKGYRPDRDWNFLWIIPLLAILPVAGIVSFVIYDNTHGNPTTWPFLRLFVLVALIGYAGYSLVMLVRALFTRRFWPALGWLILLVVSVVVLHGQLIDASAIR